MTEFSLEVRMAVYHNLCNCSECHIRQLANRRSPNGYGYILSSYEGKTVVYRKGAISYTDGI